MGRCLLLRPRREGEIALLFPPPRPADDFDANLRRRASPVKFRRTDKEDIIMPGRRCFLARMEELAQNPAAPEALQQLAIQVSRRGLLDDILLPPETDTVALVVKERMVRRLRRSRPCQPAMSSS